MDENHCCPLKDQELKADVFCGSTEEDGFVHSDPRSSVDQTLAAKGESEVIKDKKVSKFQVEILGESMCFQKDEKLNAVSVGGSTENDGVVRINMYSSAEQTELGTEVESAINDEGNSNSKLDVPGNDAVCGSLYPHTTKLNVGIVDGSTDTEHVDPDSRKDISSSKVEVLVSHVLYGDASFAEKDGFACSDPRSFVDQTLAAEGESEVIKDENISKSQVEVLGEGMCSQKDEKLNVVSVSESTENNGIVHTNIYSSAVQTELGIQEESSFTSDEGTSNSKVDVLGNGAECGSLHHHNPQLKVGIVDRSTDKDHMDLDSSKDTSNPKVLLSHVLDGNASFAEKDCYDQLLKVKTVNGNTNNDDITDVGPPLVESCKTELEVDTADGSIDKNQFACLSLDSSEEIPDPKVKDLGSHALDSNLSSPEKDLLLKIETASGSPKKDDILHGDPSLVADCLFIGDCTAPVLGKNVDIIEQNVSMQDENQETIVPLAQQFTVGVDGDKSKNPLTVEETSNHGACVSEILDLAADIIVGPQAELDSAAFCSGGDSSVTGCINPLPDGNQDLEVQMVGNQIHLADGEQAKDAPMSKVVTFHEVDNRVVNAKSESNNSDGNSIGGNFVPESGLSHFKDDESMAHSGKCDDCSLQDEVVNEKISPPHECNHEGAKIQGMGSTEEFPVLGFLDKSRSFTPSQVGSSVGQEAVVDEQVIDAEGFDLEEKHEIQAQEQPTGFEHMKSIEEEVVKRVTMKLGISAKVHEAIDELRLEPEGEFSVSDLVWGKVRSHPWWPGQIFDPSDSSEKAIKYHKKDCYLVAYFGDRTFAWNEASLLKSFRMHFSQIEKQNSSETFHNAVNCALVEVSRRVESGFACSCIPKEAYDGIKYQIVENIGIRQESSRRDGVDKSAGVDSFEPAKLLEYIHALAQFPSGGIDRLELVIAKAQLLAFNRLKGYSQLPEFQLCGASLEIDADMPLPEGKRHSSDVNGHSSPLSVDDVLVSAGKGKLKSQNSSSCKRKYNLKDSMYLRKKERSLVELMCRTPYSPDHDGSDRKASSKLASSSSGKKRRAVDSLADDSIMHDRRKSITLAKVSMTTPPSPSQSFKVGECVSRVASQLTRSPSILKCTSERLQNVDGCSDNSFGVDFDASIQISDERGKMIVPIEYSSLDEMLLQLHLAAQDPLNGYGFLNLNISFFFNYRNSIITSGRENLSMDKPSGGRKKRSSHFFVGSPKPFEFEDMSDSYGKERIIKNSSEVRPSRRGRKRKTEYQLVCVERQDSLLSGNYGMAAEKSTNYDDERKQDLSPTELILNFAEVKSVPSETNLNKMFRRFGPLRESETEVDRLTSRARVIFKRCSDAEVAFNSSGKFNIFGPTVVNYQLCYSPSVSFKSLPVAITECSKDETLMSRHF
ncbi:uncharacterized protein LOC131167099 [Malania oleifera]|uniref:uncharacterized protein LOC131167099 n=1 Tax=Malania oleifera TaxID=397392 RepID=UPI0025AE52E3|nr:uncharacterized protein LOC131167099 [Malania oleifera]